MGLEGFPQVHHLVLHFLLLSHLEVASVVLEPFHVVVCIKGMPCESFLYGHIDCRPCDIFSVVHLCKVGMYRFISKSPFYRRDYTAFA